MVAHDHGGKADQSGLGGACASSGPPVALSRSRCGWSPGSRVPAIGKSGSGVPGPRDAGAPAPAVALGSVMRPGRGSGRCRSSQTTRRLVDSSLAASRALPNSPIRSLRNGSLAPTSASSVA